MINVLTNCAAVIFTVKVSCVMSVDKIEIDLVIDLIGQLSHDDIGCLSVRL